MANDKLIVNNTIALYIRSFLSLIIALYTSRLILAYLGVENYGVYNAVGGIISVFAFVQSSLANVTQRYLAYYIGKGDKKVLNRMFNMCLNVHILLSLVLIIFLEPIGSWYIQNKLDYGVVSESDVAIIFHTSVASLFFLIVSIPYNSLILSNESMKLYAYIDVFSKVLKLLLALSLQFIESNYRLSIFAIAILIINIIVFLVYYLFCNKKYQESNFLWFWDSKIFRELSTFTGYVTLPAFISIFKTQGMLVVLNQTFGPVFNAAQSVSNQINNAVKSLANNVGAAFTPQITISYAQSQIGTMTKLFISGSKITFFLFLYMMIPLCIDMDYVLSIWLVEVPEYTKMIAILVLVDTLITSMTSCYNSAIRATGQIKWYEIVYNLFHFCGLLLIIYIVYAGCEYYVPYLILIVFSSVGIFIQILFVKMVLPTVKITEMLNSLVRMVLVSICVVAIAVYTHGLLEETSFLVFLTDVLISTASISLFVLAFGFDKDEKSRLLTMVKDKFLRKRQ